MIHRKTIAAAGLVVACGAVAALAQGNDSRLGERAAPAGLEAYTDVALVLQNARHVIATLGTAKFEADPSFADKNGGECGSDEVQSFNRGFILAHTGFNMFLALQESGFSDLSGANGLTGYKHRRFVQFGRSTLIAAWTPTQLGQLIGMREMLRSLPKTTKADLAAFLTKLAEYRLHYTRLKTAKPEILEDLFRREDDGYYWYRASLEQSASAHPEYLAEQLKSMPEALGYSELSAALDKELREVSDIGKTDPNSCFVENVGLIISYPTEKLKRDRNSIYATKYMISFWRRRYMEGISELADFAIKQMLETLRSN